MSELSNRNRFIPDGHDKQSILAVFKLFLFWETSAHGLIDYFFHFKPWAVKAHGFFCFRRGIHDKGGVYLKKRQEEGWRNGRKLLWGSI